MRLLFILLFFGFSSYCSAQTDSCTITPTASASFEGVTARGMLNTGDLAKFKKMIPEESGLKILGFTYTIDCDNCDIIVHRVNSDTLTEEDIKAISSIASKHILSFECIVGTDKKGALIAYKPFLFYIR